MEHAASLLLPSVSEAQAQGNTKRIQKTIYLTIVLCFLLGVMCFLFFFTFAEILGKLLFDILRDSAYKAGRYFLSYNK